MFGTMRWWIQDVELGVTAASLLDAEMGSQANRVQAVVSHPLPNSFLQRSTACTYIINHSVRSKPLSTSTRIADMVVV